MVSTWFPAVLSILGLLYHHKNMIETPLSNQFLTHCKVDFLGIIWGWRSSMSYMFLLLSKYHPEHDKGEGYSIGLDAMWCYWTSRTLGERELTTYPRSTRINSRKKHLKWEPQMVPMIIQKGQWTVWPFDHVHFSVAFGSPFSWLSCPIQVMETRMVMLLCHPWTKPRCENPVENLSGSNLGRM